MARTIKALNSLPKDIKDKVILVAKEFQDREDVRNRAEFFTRNHGINNPREALTLAAFDRVRSKSVIKKKKLLSQIPAFDLRGNRIVITGAIDKKSHVALLKGELQGKNGKKYPVIIKHYRHGNEDITKEIEIYRKLRDAGAPTPWISTKFYFWNSRVLVMEPMLPVTDKANEIQLGLDILDQLEWLHGCKLVHNDLKPGNILVRNTKIKCPDEGITRPPNANNYQHQLIDHGGDAFEPLGHGYRRRIWTPKWCCQKKGEKKQVTTFKHDFIELGFVMKTIQCWRKGEKQKKDKKTGKYIYDPFRNFFTGWLKKYMDRVNQVDEKNIVKKDYSDLKQILQQALKAKK